jgi:hypothetical protein
MVSYVEINDQDIRDDEEMLLQDAQNVRPSYPSDPTSISPSRPEFSKTDSSPSDKPCPKQRRSQRRDVSYLVLYIEPLSTARTPPGNRHVSARRGRAGETSDFFSILLVELYGRCCRDGCMHRQGASGSPCPRVGGVLF